MGENATALQASLDRLLDAPGVIGVALVDAVTGLVYGAAGDATEAGDGAESSEFAALVAQRLGAAGAEGDLESVILTSRRRHQMLFPVVRPAGDPLLLTAGLDRDRANVALALRGLGDRVTEVLS